MKTRPRILLASLVLVGMCDAAPPIFAAEGEGANTYCGAIVGAVDASAPGNGPTFVASYQAATGEAVLPEALRASAFSYDNALAAIALIACGDVPRAARIADAFLAAMSRDRAFNDGRVRNAYSAGAVADGAVKLPGWWDSSAKRWDEDAYQDGTATGNVAWVALALLNMHAATGRADYLAAASRLLGWIHARASDGPGPAGYSGGVSGFDDAQLPLTWKSTEHNIDVAAAAHWAHALTRDPAEVAMADQARMFVSTRFRREGGYFILGTKSDGSDADPGQLALDAQLWPVLGAPNAPPEWRRAVDFTRVHLRRGDGMTFAGIGPNQWTEGSAQAALAFRAIGDEAGAEAFLKGLPSHVSPTGFLFATSAAEVPTGLTVEGGSGEPFKYYHWPHLGATAWAALAAAHWNPFTGERVH
jgi:hypothetical protein